VFYENTNSRSMLLVLLINGPCLLVQTVFRRNFRNFCSIILEFVDVTNYLALVGPNCSQKEEILQVLVITEWRRFNDNYPFVKSRVVGLMIGASASTCSFCYSFFDRSLTSFSNCANYSTV
jgi:hypothetical protein